MSAPENKAVFLSYASQDAEAARRICSALRASGVEVWFDQSELRGGDAWDAKIRRQIKECALFVPIISANSEARLEGYFRLEWKLAAQRTHTMAEEKAFLVPLVIDETRDADSKVPVEFRAVQWTRLLAGQPMEAFSERIRMLLGHPASHLASNNETPPISIPTQHERWGRWTWVIAASMLVLIVSLWSWSRRAGVSGREGAASTVSSSRNRGEENEKSLVVLPLENLSPDPENAFFTDGMHSEIISTLSRLADLKVISRNSSNAFRGSGASPAEFAQKLGVANVITGSVRRAGNQVRIQLELRRARDDALLWAQDYGRGLQDVFAVQSEIADEVARVLQARGRRGRNAAAQLMTKNAEAYDLFLKAEGTSLESGPRAEEMLTERIRGLEEALRLDPNFVTAAGRLSGAHSRAYGRTRNSAERVRHAAEAKRWGETASRLMPGGAGDGSLAYYYAVVQPDNARALALGESAVRALPNEVLVLNYYAIALGSAGREVEAVEYYRRALVIEPFASIIWTNLASALVRLRRMDECAEALSRGTLGNTDVSRADKVAFIRYAIAGNLPSDLADMTAVQRAVWLGRSRHYDEQLATVETALAGPKVADLDQFPLKIMRADALRALGRDAAARDAGQDALTLAENLREQPAVDRSDADWRLALALARVGRRDDAFRAGGLWVEGASASNQVSLRRRRELELAELHAYFGRARECVELLGKLLRVPAGITVPMLRVDPAWDKVRDNSAFKALLTDPKNTAPL